MRHWGARMVTDSHRGYGGYLVRKSGRAVVFAGDTAYTDLFARFRERGPIDLAILPIGAYDPWIYNHASPEQAWEMFRDLGAEYSAPDPPLHLPAQPGAHGRADPASPRRGRKRPRAGGAHPSRANLDLSGLAHRLNEVRWSPAIAGAIAWPGRATFLSRVNMPESHHFLTNLALVLCVAAATSLLFQRLRQPVVFGYLLAGMIIGPHIPVPLVADEGLVHTLAELGVILLMFSLGLEFSLRKLFRVAPTAGIIAVLQSSAMVCLGFGLGRIFGWTVLESVFAGAIIAISSTTIIVKAFAEQKVSGKVTDIVFGVLIIEDLIAILLLAILTAVASGGSLSAWELTRTGMRLAAFLVGLVAVGLLVVPRLIRMTVRLGSPETTLVAAIGISFATALLAITFGYSVALGAFIAGSLVAESGQGRRSSTWSLRCATCSPPSSSSPSACSSTRC